MNNVNKSDMRRMGFALPSGWSLTLYLCGAALLVSLAILIIGGFSEQALLQVLRFSARSAMFAFLLAFSASSLHLLWPTTFSRWLRQQRRYLGMAFAVIFLLHGIAIGLRVVWFPKNFVETLSPVVIYVGGFAFVVALLMAITSNNNWQRRLGPIWKGLHWLGNYYILLQFVGGEVLRVQKNPHHYLPYVVLLLMVMLLRVGGRFVGIVRWFNGRSAASSVAS